MGSMGWQKKLEKNMEFCGQRTWDLWATEMVIIHEPTEMVI
jgi:hypothetical protein